MGLTNAILTAFTGIQSNQIAVDTIGNNVANVNTTGFKNSRTLFETLFFHTVTEGTAPDAQQGGTNPLQYGYGTGLATVQRNFTQGTTERTGVPSDLAVDGEGLFIVRDANNTQRYTRDGSFTLNTQNRLVMANGSFVQGFAASQDGTIESGTLTELEIPLGTASVAVATTEARLLGNLNSLSDLAASGSVSTSAPMTISGGAAAAAGSALTSLVGSDGTALYNSGDVITINGVQKGGLDVAPAQFVVGVDGSTYGELATFLQTAWGIDTTAATPGSAGVTIGDGTGSPAGTLVVRSNVGDVNALSIDGASIRNATNGTAPFVFTTEPATGEGVTTSFLVFDSLGAPVELRLRAVMESQTDSGTTWRFSVESSDGQLSSQSLGTGTVTLDQNGQFVNATGTTLSVPRDASGAVNPLAVALDFSEVTGLATTDEGATLAMSSQDGHPEGTLNDFEIGRDGVITGTFTNAQQRVLGQVALATFANTRGLVAQSQNLFVEGVNSGAAVISAPQTGRAGGIQSGELELSNVDLSRELIGLITASTGFSAASRTVRTADDMLQELMLLVR